MPVTSKQIAELAGVSRGTVDRALNNRGGVKKEVSERIRQIADELGYRPNLAGKALVGLKNPVRIGVITPAAGNPFFDEVMRGIHRAEKEYAGFGISAEIIQTAGFDSGKQLHAIQTLAQSEIGALMIAPIDTPQVRSALSALSVPLVLFNSDLSGVKKLCYIGQNYKKCGKTAANLLGLMTDRTVRVAVLTGSLQMRGHNERVQGFKEVIAQTSRITLTQILETGDDDATAYQITRTLLEDGQIDAIFVAAGGTAGVLRAVREFENRPRIITCDAQEQTIAALKEGYIDATICQEPERQGYESFRALCDWILNHNRPPKTHLYTAVDIRIKENVE